ncbi:MAG: fluoride efflux transporter CrcB [Pseudomonadota bacterium]
MSQALGIQALLVACGGAIGASARFLFGAYVLHHVGPGFPLATLLVNVIGSFAMGVLAQLAIAGLDLSTGARLFLMTGILGGFTTFSAFSLDAIALSDRGELSTALIYIVASVTGAIVALVAGQTVVRMLMSG